MSSDDNMRKENTHSYFCHRVPPILECILLKVGASHVENGKSGKGNGDDTIENESCKDECSSRNAEGSCHGRV